MARRTPFACMLILLALGAALAAPAREGRLRERLAERRQAQAAAPAEGPPGALRQPGDYRYTLLHDGIEREYLVHVPRDYDPRRATPVVFAFHGGGGHMEHMAGAAYGLSAKADREGFIAVFPNGYSRLPGGRFATWNAGDCCGDARDRDIDDVGFVRRVHADVARRLNVDRRRVFAAGMSNGGMMSYRLACEAADLFRAVASVAGTDVTRTCRPARPVPVLHIHALDDTHVLHAGGAGADAFRDRDKVTDFPPVAATVDAWSRRGDCAAPRRIVDGAEAWCELRAPCRGDARVQLCTTRAGGHSWPGGAALRGKSPSTALDANDMIWRFFSGL